jgi:tRNA A-37 threonylcarbamoyl transferase component Bud32/streptogramin lyase
VSETGVSDRLGTELAGYRIESVLGRGGMGVVYLATDLRLERRVALKLVAPELAQDARFRERFLRESRLAASLDHSHVVPVYAAGELDGQLWIAMRYVPGEDLATLLAREGSLEPARALGLCSQVGSALDAAHKIGLVHRDVKPANVLVTEEDGHEHCYLTDFGLSRGIADVVSPGESPHLSGTVDYAAPEQIAHESADERTDLYSLACVLYECLAGEPPFKRPRPTATLFAHASEPPPSLHQQRPELPPAIDPVIAKALAKDARERYASSGDLTEAAREALGLAERRFTRRRLVLVGTGAALAVAAAAAVPAILLGSGNDTPIVAAQKPILPLADTSLVRIDPASAELVAAVELGGAPTSVDTGFGSVWIVDPRESALKELDPATNTVTRSIPVTPAPKYIFFGGDAGWVATYGETTDTEILWRLEPRTGSLSRFADTGGWAEGRSLWLWNYEEIYTIAEVDVESGRVLETIRIPRLNNAVGLSFDREAVWVTHPEAPSLLKRLDPRTGEVVAEIEVGPVETSLAENGQVWVATNDGSVVRIDPATNQVADTIEVTRSPKLLVLGGDSLWVADARDPVVARVDPETGDVITIRVGGTPLSMAFGEGGLWVIVRPS